MLTNKRTSTMQAGLQAVIGIVLVAQSIVRFIGTHFHHAHLALLNLGMPSSIVLTLIGIVLLYLAPYMYKRREVAFILVVGFSFFAMVVSLLQRRPPIILLSLLGTLAIWLVLTRRLYKVKSDQVRLRFGIRMALIMIGVGLIYGAIGFLVLGRAAFHQEFSIYEALMLSLRGLFTLQEIAAPTLAAQVFSHSLDVIGGLIYILIVTSLFKPVRFALLPSRHDIQRAQNILERTSSSSEDYFKLWPEDKHYYFSPSNQSFLTYKLSGKSVIILGDPSGVPHEFVQLVKEFRAFVASNGWRIVVLNSTSISETLYVQKAFSKLFIGNEAIITTAEYKRSTIRSKHFRYIYNKAKRESLSVEQWHDLGTDRIKVLKQISDAWLTRAGRKEYTFFMGYFDAYYLRSGSVMVLKQGGRVIAYITVMRSFVETAASIDQLRALPSAPSVAMHYLLGRTIELLSDQGKRTLNIGLAPLSGVHAQDDQPLLTSGLLRLIKKLGSRYYSFAGVEQFKSKSQPVWHPRYLYYTGGLAALPGVARDIERASEVMNERKHQRRVMVGVGFVVLMLVLIQFV